MTFRPMLAATVDDVAKLRFPLLASPKLDGIRALVLNGVVVSRNLKPIPNKHVQTVLGHQRLNGLDGELIVGDPTDPAAFRQTSSGIMAIEGQPRFAFHVFDAVSAQVFADRLSYASSVVARYGSDLVYAVKHFEVLEEVDLLNYEEDFLEQGYEGLMLRDPGGCYKHGRSTFKEHGLLKLKRFADAEAEVLGFEEQLQNTNEAKRDALGAQVRSTKKAGMRGKATLGALRVKGLNGPYKDIEFRIGSGFDDALRASVWLTQAMWLGSAVKYRYFPGGSKDAPRFPVFVGARHPNDS